MWLEQGEEGESGGCHQRGIQEPDLTGPCGHPKAWAFPRNEVGKAGRHGKVLNHGMTQSEFHFSQITPATEGARMDADRSGGRWL